MQGKHRKPGKKLASPSPYISPNQLTIEGLETPFERRLNQNNRWVRLARSIPWDKIVPIYNRLFNSSEGRMPINGRVVIGAMIIKHIEGLSDRDTIQHITAKLKETSESWIACIALVLNLVRLTRHALLRVIQILVCEQIGLKKWGEKIKFFSPQQLRYLASPKYTMTIFKIIVY